MTDDDDADYAFYDTMNEVLSAMIIQVEKTRNSNPPQLGWRLKMVRLAINCAIDIYDDYVEMQKGKK
jgi:hypothetical protein